MKMKKTPLLIIGLTGSIGMGKSTAARFLAGKGARLFDADKAVRNALSLDGTIKKKVARLIPESVRAGKISRKILGDIVFQNARKRKALEAILHPWVWRQREKFLKEARAQGAKAVVLDVPLLFETGEDKKCDVTLCLTAARKIQKERVLKRKAMTEKKWKAIVKTQMPDREKRKKADFVVRTDGGLVDMRRQLKDFWKEKVEKNA